MSIATTAPELVFQVDTGTLYMGDYAITGIASQDMVVDAAMTVDANLTQRLSALENELNGFKQKFTAELATEIIKRCEICERA